LGPGAITIPMKQPKQPSQSSISNACSTQSNNARAQSPN
jgi:hypothetical protein